MTLVAHIRWVARRVWLFLLFEHFTLNIGGARSASTITSMLVVLSSVNATCGVTTASSVRHLSLQSCAPLGGVQVVALATAEPETSSQAAHQALASTSVVFNGCDVAVVPNITVTNLKLINFTTFTWTLTQNVTTAKGIALIPSSADNSTAVRDSPLGNNTASMPSAAATVAATAATSAATNVSASAYLSSKAPGVLVVPLGKNVTESLTVVSEITRLPGVDNGLFGLEGQVVASAPGKDPLEVAGGLTIWTFWGAAPPICCFVVFKSAHPSAHLLGTSCHVI